MTTQLAASLWVPGEQFPLLFAIMSVTVVAFLLFVLRKGKRMFGRTEVLAGLGNGFLQVISISTMFLALRTFKSEVVFQYTIGMPVIPAPPHQEVRPASRNLRPGVRRKALGDVSYVQPRSP